jgi:YD repeat-containing protein
MTTYTYDPGIGMTSKCDERNRVTYYEYDQLNRLKLTRDNDMNILQLFEYNYKN